jgi:hypothetical protein
VDEWTFSKKKLLREYAPLKHTPSSIRGVFIIGKDFFAENRVWA